jgi:hypothetical protein
MAYKSSMSEREDEAGLNPNGNNTMSGRGLGNPTMDEREAAAGLNADGNRTNNFEFELASFLGEFEDFINEETSLIRQQSSSASRRAEKTLKDNYREAINNAINTSDKRELKKERDEKIEDALQEIQKAKDAATEDLNKMGEGDSLKDDSTDETGSAPDNSKSNPAGDDDEPNTFTLDIVKSDNTAGTATFNGPGIN